MASLQATVKVSVIIPAYNYARYLERAVDSALAQSAGNVEVIVVDDGSTDETPAVCAAYGDRIVYHRKENAGLSAARNTGIDLSNGTYIALLDADDAWEKDHIAGLLKAFATRDDSDLGIVASYERRMDGAGVLQVPNKPRARFDRDLHLEDFLIRNRFFPSATLILREVFERCGTFDTALTSSEDRDMWIRTVASGYRILQISPETALIRRHGGNMSKNAERMERNIRAVLDKVRASGAVSSDAVVWRQVEAFRHYQMALINTDARQFMCAACFLIRSVLAWPIFVTPAKLDEPNLFRLRAVARIVRAMLSAR